MFTSLLDDPVLLHLLQLGLQLVFEMDGAPEWRVNVFFTVFTEVPQWGAADAEIKVPSGENTELKRSPFSI